MYIETAWSTPVPLDRPRVMPTLFDLAHAALTRVTE
jgi:hypothetical protein